MSELKPAQRIHAGLALGAISGLLLFAAERLLAARVHMAAQPGGGDLTTWLLGTAGIYLLWGLAVGGLALLLPPLRRWPALVPHAVTLLAAGAAIALLPNWYGVLPAVVLAAVGADLLWLVVRRRPWPLTAALLGVTAGAVALCAVHPRGQTTASPPDPDTSARGAPDLVLVVLDTVRRDHTSAYGYAPQTTPAFDRLAAGGARLDRAYSSSPWSLPAHATLFTGRSPGSHGAHYEHPVLDPAVPTLAATLAAHGYETVGISGNPWLTPDNGTGGGFHRWVDSTPVRDVARCFVLRWMWADHTARDKGGADSVVSAREHLAARTAADPPLFLFVNLYEAHAPYDAVPADCGGAFLPEGAPRRELRRLSTRLELAQTAGTSYLPHGRDRVLTDALYDGAVHCADRRLGELLEAVALTGRPTVTVVLSDHGEALGEHDMVGHHYGLWDLLIHVPMAVHYPAEIAPGTVVETPVRGVDLMPTLLDYAGVPAGAWPAAEGSSVRGILAGGGRDPAGDDAHDEVFDEVSDEAFAEHFVPVFIVEAFRFARPAGKFADVDRRRRTVIHDDWRYEVDSRGGERLFDLVADPGEERDLLDREIQPAATPPLRQRLAGWIGRTGGPWGDTPNGVPDTKLDEETIARLRALGYLQ